MEVVKVPFSYEGSTPTVTIVPTKQSIDVHYSGFTNYDSVEIEVYEYDFKNMEWNQDTM